MRPAKAVLLTAVIVFWLSLCLVPLCLGIKSVQVFDSGDGIFAAIPLALRWSIALSAIISAAAAIGCVAARRNRIVRCR